MRIRQLAPGVPERYAKIVSFQIDRLAREGNLGAVEARHKKACAIVKERNYKADVLNSTFKAFYKRTMTGNECGIIQENEFDAIVEPGYRRAIIAEDAAWAALIARMLPQINRRMKEELAKKPYRHELEGECAMMVEGAIGHMREQIPDRHIAEVFWTMDRARKAIFSSYHYSFAYSLLLKGPKGANQEAYNAFLKKHIDEFDKTHNAGFIRLWSRLREGYREVVDRINADCNADYLKRQTAAIKRKETRDSKAQA